MHIQSSPEQAVTRRTAPITQPIAIPSRARARLQTWLREHEFTVAALLYLLLAVITLWPALLNGAVPLPLMNAYAQGDPVWSAHAPDSTASGTNMLLGDISGFYYPYVVFSIEQLRLGQFPLWNPDTFGGIPYFAANQAALLYPINLLTFWLGPYQYWAAAALVRLVLAGCGTFLLGRRLGMRALGAFLAGGIYMLADFNTVWLHFAIHNVAALLPMALWLILRLLTTGASLAAYHNRQTALLLAIIVAAQLFGGHPEMSLLFMVVCGGFTLAFWRRSRSRAWLRLGVVAAMLALGLALAAVQWLPTLDLVSRSYTIAERGFAADQADPSYAPLGGLRHAAWDNLRHWLLLVQPQLWGSPRGEAIKNWIHAATNYNEMTSYVGLATLPLALYGIWRGRNRRAAWVFGGALLASLLLLYPMPGLRLLGFLPLLDVAHGFRFGAVIALCAALLAGFGLDALTGRSHTWERIPGAYPQRPRSTSVTGETREIVAIAALSAAFAAISLVIVAGLWHGQGGDWLLGFSPTQAERNQIAVVFNSENWRLFLPGAAGLLSALLLAWAAIQRTRRQATPLLPLALVAAIVIGELAAYGFGYNGFSQPDAIYPTTPAIERLAIGASGRTLNLDNTFWANSAMTHGLQVTGGMDDLKPGDQSQFLERGMAGIVATNDHQVVMEWGRRLMDLMNVSFITSRRPLQLGPREPALEPELRDGDLLVYRYEGALPRAYAAVSVVESSAKDAEDTVFSPTFDPHKAVVLEQTPTALRDTQPQPIIPVTVSEYTANRVALVPDLAQASVVVLADAYDPDWHVTIDGQVAPLLRANGMFRGVLVPAGQHQVVFSYRPRLVFYGALLSLAALAIGIVFMALRRFTPRHLR